MGGTSTPINIPPMSAVPGLFGDDSAGVLNGAQTPQDQPSATPSQPVPQPGQPPATPAQQELQAAAVHHSRLASILSRVGSILGGDTTLTLTRDPDGNVSVTHNPSTGGEKWGRVAQAALGGLAAGFQNNQGPGGFGRAVGAGIQSGMQLPQQRQDQAQNQATQLTEQNQKDQLFKANMALLDQKNIAARWENKTKPIEWQQAQDTNDNTTAERMADLGAKVNYVGTANDPGELADLGTANPSAVASHTGATGDGSYIQHFTDRNGVMHIYQVPGDVAKQRIPKDVTLTQLNKDPDHPGQYLKTPFTIRAGSTNAQLDLATKGITDHNNSVVTETQDYGVKKETADTGMKKVPSEIREANARANQANAAAGLDTEKTRQLKTTGFEGGANQPYDPTNPLDVMAMKMADGEQMQGQIFSRMPPAQKLQLNARAEALSQQKYGLPYDPTSITRENNFASNQKTQAYYKATGALLGTPGNTGVLDNLVTTAQAAGITDNPATNAAILATAHNPISALLLRPERLAAIQAYESALNEAKRNVSTAAGNPLVANSDSDIKLKQMDKTLAADVPTLSAIRSATNQVKVSATAERNSNMQNNRFLRRIYGPGAPAGNTDLTPPPSGNNNPPPAPAVTKPPIPQGHTPAVNYVKGSNGQFYWIEPGNMAAARKQDPNLVVIP